MESGFHAMEGNRFFSILGKGALALGIAVIVVGAAMFLFEGDKMTTLISRLQWLHIREVSIQGEWPTTPEVVKGWLPSLEGKSILLIRSDQIAAEIEKKAWVRAVTITKEYPDRVRVDVTPKRAVAVTLEKGRPHFLDTEGKIIERVTAPMLQRLNLPVISREENTAGWETPAILKILETFASRMSARYKVSQITLGTFPYFRVFLASPQIEVAFSVENWEEQLPHLALLLDSPPNQIGQIQRITLYYSKKAVVRSTLSN